MKSSFQRMVAVLVLFTLVLGVIPASISAPESVLNNSNELLAASIPVSYGDDAFRRRILERTGGEREPVGLVLSGGSARAFAHIGVLQYLEEQGIVPDFIISNSMGSVVGLLYAAGLSPQQIHTVCSQIDITRLFDLSVPLEGGLLDTSRFVSLVAAYLGEDLRMEELPIPIMVVAEDIATKRQVRIMEGNFLTVVEASFAIPVYFSPVLYNGHVLIDGGITNLVPLDIAYEYTDSVVVSTTFYEGKDINLRNSLSILNTAIEIGKRREGVNALLAHPDVMWIRCDVEDFSFMDFGSIDEIAAKGYESASSLEGEWDIPGTGEIPQEIRDIRSAFSAREKQVLDNYRLYKEIPQSRSAQQVFFGMRSFHYDGDPWYLRNETLFGVAYNLRRRAFGFSLTGGVGWETASPMEAYPDINASVSYNPVPPVMIDADLSLSGEEGGWLPSLYNRLGIEARMNFFDTRLTVGAVGSWENQLTSSFALDAMLINGALFVDWVNGPEYPFSLSVEGGWQMGGNYDRRFFNTRVSSTFPLSSDFKLHAGYVGRYALDGLGNVPFYLGDGFRTADSTILTQGFIGGAANPTANHLIVGKFDILWEPESFKPTAGEILIFEDSSIGLYTGMLWRDAGQMLPEVSVGAQLCTTISLLGLNAMPASVYVGYDGPSSGIVWGFVFGR